MENSISFHCNNSCKPTKKSRSKFFVYYDSTKSEATMYTTLQVKILHEFRERFNKYQINLGVALVLPKKCRTGIKKQTHLL
jgi:hypothetical protein